jgi:hypothetical protein
MPGNTSTVLPNLSQHKVSLSQKVRTHQLGAHHPMEKIIFRSLSTIFDVITCEPLLDLLHLDKPLRLPVLLAVDVVA